MDSKCQRLIILRESSRNVRKLCPFTMLWTQKERKRIRKDEFYIRIISMKSMETYHGKHVLKQFIYISLLLLLHEASQLNNIILFCVTCYLFLSAILWQGMPPVGLKPDPAYVNHYSKFHHVTTFLLISPCFEIPIQFKSICLIWLYSDPNQLHSMVKLCCIK